MRGWDCIVSPGILWTLGFNLHCMHVKPYHSNFANAIKTATDLAFLVTMVLSVRLSPVTRGALPYGLLIALEPRLVSFHSFDYFGR